MSTRFIAAIIAVLIGSTGVFGQAQPPDTGGGSGSAWHPPGGSSASPSGKAASAERPGTAAPRRSITRVTSGDGSLPKTHGQVWREYDISPYTVRVTTTERPEQAVVDWILRETGYEKWHSEPLGVLSATPRKLRVYHTPEMQAVVADLVDRFVASEAETMAFSLRVVTIDHPNWRARAQRMLRPVAVRTPGTGAWLLQKEDAAVLLAEMRRRSDYREHSSPHLLINNGQSTVVSAMRSRSYVRDVILRNDAWPGFQAETGQIDEGFTLEFGPLLSVDRQQIDALIKCHIDQVEKMIPVVLDVPTRVAPRQRTRIDVPQMAHFRFEERFRWPVGQVLLVSMGVVALPVPVDAKPLVPGIPLMGTAPRRADLLVFVEAKLQAPAASGTADTRSRETKNYHGRY